MNQLSPPVQRWNEVIGQDRVLRVLHAILRQPRFMPRGLIFEGPYGVGKTSCAYLMARALMCVGNDPLGCGVCPSCLMADSSLNDHPAFTEVDAASTSGVKEARALMETLSGPPALGRRHVVLIDEAHRLTTEAFDVFLKPLDVSEGSISFLFVTTAVDKIPDTIQSRCACMRFGSISTDDLTGMLMAIADREKIDYTEEGLRTVARYAKGRPRDARVNLGLVAATGPVTKEATAAALNHDAETIMVLAFRSILGGDVGEAVRSLDELAQRIGPVAVIQAALTVYSRDLFAGGQVSKAFVHFPEMNQFFLKWSSTNHLSLDAVPLFVLELQEKCLPSRGQQASEPTAKTHQRPMSTFPQADTSTASVRRSRPTLTEEASVSTSQPTPTERRVSADEFKKRIGKKP